MSRAGFAVAFLVALTPLAAAQDAEQAAADAQDALLALVAAAQAEVDAATTGLGSGDGAHDEPDGADADEEPAAADGEEAREDAPPTYREDPLLAPLVDASPLPIRPVAKTLAGAPVAGGLLGDAFRSLGLDEDGAAAGSAGPAAAPIAPAAAAPPAPPAPSSAAEAAAIAVVAVGVAGAAAGAASVGPLLLEKLRRVAGLLGVALYTRLARKELLDHGVRDRIYAAIRDRPGLTIQDLAKVGGVGRTAAAYHLRVLEREAVVGSRRDGRVRRYHLNGASLESAERLAALGHPTGRALADVVAREPGIDQTALAGRLAIGSSLAHWHLKRLEAAGVVSKSRDGRKVRYFPVRPAA